MRFLHALCLVLLMWEPAWAQQGITLIYQGHLSNAAGGSVTASHTMTFALYADENIGNCRRKFSENRYWGGVILKDFGDVTNYPTWSVTHHHLLLPFSHQSWYLCQQFLALTLTPNILPFIPVSAK